MRTAFEVLQGISVLLVATFCLYMKYSDSFAVNFATCVEKQNPILVITALLVIGFFFISVMLTKRNRFER